HARELTGCHAKAVAQEGSAKRGEDDSGAGCLATLDLRHDARLSPEWIAPGADHADKLNQRERERWNRGGDGAAGGGLVEAGDGRRSQREEAGIGDSPEDKAGDEELPEEAGQARLAQ